MLDSGNLDVSFSGLKTAVALKARAAGGGDPAKLSDASKADIAHAFQAAVVDVLVAKSIQALGETGLSTLVLAGGVGANRELRARLVDAVERRGGRVFFPEPKYCTDNGAMIAMAGALRIASASTDLSFSVRPRWPLQ
jgi:N6-L-threonylcarbamoyladenine synthase